MTTYNPTVFVDDQAPALNAANLNKTEQGIADAHNEIASLQSSMVGIIMYFPANNIPQGWLKCNGANNLSKTAYNALYSVIGDTYGNGIDADHFKIPDLRGYFIRGWDHGAGVDPGRAFASIQQDDIKAHSHTFTDDTAPTRQVLGENFGIDRNWCTSTGRTSGSTGGSESRPKNVALIACIHY